MTRIWRFTSEELGPVSSDFYDKSSTRIELSDIRILTLLRGPRRDTIICKLEKSHLAPSKISEVSDKPDLDCTTLSYVWGNSRRNIRTICVNREDFKVTSNLHSALLHLRRVDEDVRLWIDAICINQKNNTEKDEQVKRMDEIYRHSKATIIWLGNGGWLAGAAFNTLSNMAMNLGHREEPNSSCWKRAWHLIEPFLVLLLLRSKYFTRIWIIQEVALSNHISVLCGPHRISWHEFALGATITLEAHLGSQSASGLGNVLIARALLPWATKIGQRDPAWIHQTLNQRSVPHPNNILAMATLFRRSHATDPVDKLFGLLGLCKYINQGSTFAIEPSYNRNDREHYKSVYIDSARRILEAQNGLGLFSAVNRRRLGWIDFVAGLWLRICGKTQLRPLPTWVPDWSNTGSAATPLGLMLAQAQAQAQAQFTNLIPDYNFDFASIQQNANTMESGNGNMELHTSHSIYLTGTHITDIIELGTPCNTEASQRSFLFSLRYTFTMCENHRLGILSTWYHQFRAFPSDPTFWNRFITTATCNSAATTQYNERNVLRLLSEYRHRFPASLTPLMKTILAILVAGPIVFTAYEGTTTGLMERVKLYYVFPTFTMTTLWYLCFQIVPNAKFMFQDRWQAYGVGDEFLKKEFDHMELRRMARFKYGELGLIPEAAKVGDQIWRCRGGIVPLVLREKGIAFEVVGECYFNEGQRAKGEERVIRVV